MKKSKRYIKKQNNKPLINKKVLAKVIREINLVQRLCDWDIISPLKFTDDEWCQISSDGTCQNRRKGDVFKEPDGSIHYNGAFNKRPISIYIILILKNGLIIKILFVGMVDYLNINIIFLPVDILINVIYYHIKLINY